VKNLAQKSDEPLPEDAGLRNATAASFGPSHAIGTRFVLDRTMRAVVTEHPFQSGQQVRNWHADSSRGSIVHLSGERIAPRDLEPNLSQTSHLFQFIPKLAIFICKQLKRPVAFDTVQNANSHAVG